MIGDFAAGLADLLAFPTDAISLGMGAIKYPFKKVFTDSENPFAEGVANSWAGQFSQGIRDFNTDLFDSDPESKARRAGSDIGGFALDLFTGGSGTMMRQGIKRAANRATRRSGAKLMKKALADTAVTNTLINSGMSMLSGEGLTPTETGIAALGVMSAPSMIRRGVRIAASKHKLDDVQTEAQKWKSNLRRYDLYDERQGAVDLARQQGFDLDPIHTLSVKDEAKLDPILEMATDDLKKINPAIAEDLNRYDQLLSETQQRLQAIITPFEDAAGPTKELRELADKLGFAGVDLNKVRETLLTSKFDDLYDLFKKHPEAFPETGYMDAITGLPISNTKLALELDGARSKLTAKDLELNRDFFGRALRADLKANLDAGLISQDEYNRMLARSANIGYIPKVSMEHPTEVIDNLSGVTRSGSFERAATETGQGVMRQANSFRTTQGILQRHAEDRLMNSRTKTLLAELKAKVPTLIKQMQDGLTTSRLTRSKDKYYAKMLLADKEYYLDRLKELNKFDFNPSKEALRGAKANGQRVVQYFEGGEARKFLVPDNYIHSLFEYSPRNNSNIIKGIQRVQNFALPFRTGKYNVANFGFVKLAYGLWEAMPALITEARAMGKDISYWKIMAEQLKQAKNIFSNEYYNWLINNIEHSGSKLWYRQEDLPVLRQKLKETLTSIYVSPVDNFADLKRAGASRLFDVINPDTATKMEKLGFMANQAWNFVDKSAPVEIMRMLNQAAGDSASATITKLSRELFNDDEMAQELIRRVSKKTSDTRRRGAGISKVGQVLNLLQDVMPYGRSSIQGLLGKLEYFQLGKNWDEIRNITGRFNGTWDSGMEIMTRLNHFFADKMQGQTFDMLWKCVVAPTALCYFWNNMTPENAEDYHELSTMARSKNRLLVNFGGRGVHAWFPVDQEWSMLSSLTEGLLDSAFNLSDKDTRNPEFAYTDQILKAAGRALGIEFPVPVNLATEALGFKATVNPETLLGNEPVFEGVRERRGDMLPAEVSAMLGEILGTVGNSISAMASKRPFNTDMLGQIPLLTDSWSQEHYNQTARYVDNVYRKDPINSPVKDLMNKRKYLEARLRQFNATGMTMDGRSYNMPRQKVIETIQHNINKVNRQMYDILKDQEANV